MVLMKDATTFVVAWLRDDATVVGKSPSCDLLMDSSDTCQKGGRRKKDAMYIEKLSKGNLSNFTHLPPAWIHSFSIVLVMFKRLQKSFVYNVLGPFASMEGNICCPYSSVTWLITDHFE